MNTNIGLQQAPYVSPLVQEVQNWVQNCYHKLADLPKCLQKEDGEVEDHATLFARLEKVHVKAVRMHCFTELRMLNNIRILSVA